MVAQARLYTANSRQKAEAAIRAGLIPWDDFHAGPIPEDILKSGDQVAYEGKDGYGDPSRKLVEVAYDQPPRAVVKGYHATLFRAGEGDLFDDSIEYPESGEGPWNPSCYLLLFDKPRFRNLPWVTFYMPR